MTVSSIGDVRLFVNGEEYVGISVEGATVRINPGNVPEGGAFSLTYTVKDGPMNRHQRRRAERNRR